MGCPLTDTGGADGAGIGEGPITDVDWTVGAQDWGSGQRSGRER